MFITVNFGESQIFLNSLCYRYLLRSTFRCNMRIHLNLNMEFLTLKEWKKANIADLSKIKTEEDVKNHVILPYLNYLGYSTNLMRFENSMDVQAGTKSIKVKSDIEIAINGNIEVVLDTKAPTIPLKDKQILQSISYAKLVSTPPAIYAIVSNGSEIAVTNIYSGKRIDSIPPYSQLLSDISRTRKKELSKIEIREVSSLLLTLGNIDELYKIINTCKGIIEKRGLIRSDQSFKEMTKILLVKMNEEKRAKGGETNRFQYEIISQLASAHSISFLDEFKLLFQEAIQTYPIYSDSEVAFIINDDSCLIEVVKNLEPWSFLGTGDDIKGAVYEIFLKSTLRGDFDQYFTPREIVDFMVKFADPKIDDIILDPACGSGGFLIQSFLYVNQKITNSPFSAVESKKKFQNLIDKCLWGGEADEDLHVLAKINLIMHGDGYNNIYQGDSLRNDSIPNDKFNLILTNPPFTLPYTFTDVLNKYELGENRQSQELDLLFVEKCIKALDASSGGEIYIVLPEGLLNLASYNYFRSWLLSKCYITLVCSLPEGAFIPFGKSVSKTAILGLRKKNELETNKPNYAFLCSPKEIGYECGKSTYKIKDSNDLPIFLQSISEYFEGIRITENEGEYGWIPQDEINFYRIDANYLLNKIDLERLHKSFPNLQRLDRICRFKHESFSPRKENKYSYLEIPDVSPTTGVISNIRVLQGNEIGSSFYTASGGDLAYCRINPRKNRVFIIPEGLPDVLISKEAYIIDLIENEFINSKFVLAAILQSDLVRSQLVRLATGSSSSRARVQEDDFLKAVFIPIPDRQTQNLIHRKMKKMLSEYWKAAQSFLDDFIDCQKKLLSDVDKNKLRSI